MWRRASEARALRHEALQRPYCPRGHRWLIRKHENFVGGTLLTKGNSPVVGYRCMFIKQLGRHRVELIAALVPEHPVSHHSIVGGKENMRNPFRGQVQNVTYGPPLLQYGREPLYVPVIGTNPGPPDPISVPVYPVWSKGHTRLRLFPKGLMRKGVEEERTDPHREGPVGLSLHPPWRVHHSTGHCGKCFGLHGFAAHDACD